MISFLQLSEQEGIIADFIREKGEGIHHIALEVEDIENAVKELKSRGIKFIWDIETGSKGAKVAFIHPDETGNILIELMQP